MSAERTIQPHMRTVALVLLAVPLLNACGGGKRSAYVRVVEPDGRAYYAETGRSMYTDAGGFVTFRDLVTNEAVELANGKYSAVACTEDEVAKAQTTWLQNTKTFPTGEFDPENGSDPSIWR